MNLFGVFVIVCSVFICHGQPVDDQSNRLAKQMVQYRLQHYPSAPAHQTQVIDYPGNVYSGQNVAYSTHPHGVNSHAYQRYQHPAQTATSNQYQTIRATSSNPQPIPTTTTTTTTTQLPITAPVQPVEHEAATVPAPTPVSTAHHQRRIVRPHHQASAAQRFQLNGPEFAEEVPETFVQPKPETEEERLLRLEQAKNAHYSFGTSIDDRINDHSIHRQETRNGLALRGMYSYSDGFYHRTIHYVADENGYRVTKEEIEPIGDGPQFDPNGTADVSTNLHNKNIHYSITAEDFVRDRKNKTAIAVGHENL